MECGTREIAFPGIVPTIAEMQSEPPNEPTANYDVIVIGGALSGAATATLLLRKNPGIRILIIEKSATLSRRVGEATVEVSAYFLGRVLGMTQYLNDSHISKQGLRFWFANDKVTALDQASEVGPRYLARLPSYQLDRASFDEEVLRRAEAAGATVLRPAIVSNVQLVPGGRQTMEVKHGELRLHGRHPVHVRSPVQDRILLPARSSCPAAHDRLPSARRRIRLHDRVQSCSGRQRARLRPPIPLP